jgi:hypothetical protein
MFSFSRYNNTDAVVIKLLKNLKYNIPPDSLISELERHPEYPGLLA